MIFLHIHRTGGSTIWHTLSSAAAGQNHQVIDLYYESWMAYKNPFSTVDTIEKMIADGRTEKLNSEQLFIHHHTRQNIDRSLPSEALSYATIIRDPIERFISEVFHIRKLLMHGAELTDDFPFYAGESEWYRNVLGEALYHLFMQKHINTDELLIEASKCPYYKDFYFNIFWSTLIDENNTELPNYTTPEITDYHRHILASAVREKFFYIGQYPQIKKTISDLAYLTGLSINQDTDIIHVKNASNKPKIMESTLDVLRKANEGEYLFLSMLKRPSAGERFFERAAYLERCKQEVLLDDIELMQNNIEGLQQALIDTRKKLSAVQEHAAVADEQLNLARNCLDQINRSKSWRITAPLRSIAALIRRF